MEPIWKKMTCSWFIIIGVYPKGMAEIYGMISFCDILFNLSVMLSISCMLDSKSFDLKSNYMGCKLVPKFNDTRPVKYNV